jgi:hypothetical protein
VSPGRRMDEMTATQVSTSTEPVPAGPRQATVGRDSMRQAIANNYPKIVLPVLGELHLPPPQQLAWLGGVATLAVVGILEWPVAAALGIGHLLSQQHHVQVLRDFGEALEEA